MLQRLIRLLYVDFAPRTASSNACIFQLTHEPVGRNGKTSAAHREQQNASVLLDRDRRPQAVWAFLYTWYLDLLSYAQSRFTAHACRYTEHAQRV
jgi:hypothetical protein